MTRHIDKQSFVTGFLEAQPEWREAGRIIREHERRVIVGEVTPEYINSLVPILGESFADVSEYYGQFYGNCSAEYDPIGETLYLWEQELLEEKGFMEQAEVAWVEYIGMSSDPALARNVTTYVGRSRVG